MINPEKRRLNETRSNRGWKKWGPYMTERQWGTVREDYSPDGSAWEYFSFEQAKSRAYRWGEDGIAGICDYKQHLCFAMGFWNGKDAFLKERLFGLTGNQGNHGEDVKEIYYYLDSTPTHSYMKYLYKYPHEEFPYNKIYQENSKRSKSDPEYELIDTGVFNDNKYFDIYIEYAKADSDDILIRIKAINRGKEKATLSVIPNLWFRNEWTYLEEPYKPCIYGGNNNTFYIDNKNLGNYNFYFEGKPDLMFCENETNHNKVYGHKPQKGFYKDGFNEYVVHNQKKAINPKLEGTKSGLLYKLEIKEGEFEILRFRLSQQSLIKPFEKFNQLFKKRVLDADIFYGDLQKDIDNEDLKNIQRQAYAGMLMSKQFYYFDVSLWKKGDPGTSPPGERWYGRNMEWMHLNNMEIISMPDKWEYPWYAAWDLAFHCIPLANLDPDFAKRQLILLLREWYMHPNGQIPAYEWCFSDVNPPVHAWACWRVYEIEKEKTGKGDHNFLERVFHKLLLNFTWWVNRKDSQGHNIFEGGFLGLDNIGVFDRSAPLPVGGKLEQADATSWMAMYSLNMLRISLELANNNSSYEDTASKFLEHFLYISGAISNMAGNSLNLWDDEDEFFYDVLNKGNGEFQHLKIRSMVGLIPLFAIETLEAKHLERLPHFKRRLEWFLAYRPQYANLVSTWKDPELGVRRRFSVLRGSRLKKVLKRMLDETEFLSDYGIRALSKFHDKNPYEFKTEDDVFSVKYTPGESESGMFGGNSNWRGPIWFPVNYLIIESLVKFYHYYTDDFKVEYPTGSGKLLNLKQISDELSHRLMRIFMKNGDGKRPALGSNEIFQKDENFKDNILFYEYFHGDSGQGLGASHQTGWTGLIADLIDHHYTQKKAISNT